MHVTPGKRRLFLKYVLYVLDQELATEATVQSWLDCVQLHRFIVRALTRKQAQSHVF